LTDDRELRRPSIHQLPERGLNDWVANLCTIFVACGRHKMADALKSHTLSTPPHAPPSRSDRQDTEFGTRERRTLLYRRKGLLVRRIKDSVKRKIAQSLHQLEAKWGYFLPYALSAARRDEFLSALQTVARQGDIKTALMVGAAIGNYSTEAFLAGTLENRCQPYISCIRCSARQPLFGERERHPRIKWYQSSDHSGKTRGDLEDALTMVLKDAAVERFDLIVVDASEIGQFKGMASTLLSAGGAIAVTLENLACAAGYAIYKALLDDPRYVLLCHGPGRQGGYAIFRRGKSRENAIGSAREFSHAPHHGDEVPNDAHLCADLDKPQCL
jgi:hypothetical protein